MSEHYILDENNQPQNVSFEERCAWEGNRHVGKDTVGDISVSTVFLTLGHNFTGRGKPILWETMVFGVDGNDEPCERYTSHADAVAGHKRHCEKYLPATAKDAS